MEDSPLTVRITARFPRRHRRALRKAQKNVLRLVQKVRGVTWLDRLECWLFGCVSPTNVAAAFICQRCATYHEAIVWPLPPPPDGLL